MAYRSGMAEAGGLPALPGDWPLVGRDRELAAAITLLETPHAGGIVVAGEAGAGKTRLAREIAAAAEKRGLPTARAVASLAAAGIPFGALAQLLPPGEESPSAAAIRRAADDLASLGGGRRPTIIVDDAHLLDEASAVVVHRVATEHSAFVVATVRLGEPAPDLVVGLWKDGIVDRLELGPLSASDTATLASAALGGVVDAYAAARLFELSRGNPLYLRELVRGVLEDGALVNERGVWVLRGRLEPPRRLVDLLGLRLAGLTDAERDVLETLAVADSLGLTALEDLTKGERLGPLERRGLIELAIDGRRRPVRLSHPLYAEFLRARMPKSRALSLGLELAGLLVRTGARRRGDLLRLAGWRLGVGGSLDDRLRLEAARQAAYVGDTALAIRLAASAVDAGAGAEASLLLGRLLDEEGRHEEAEEVFAQLDVRALDEGARADAANARADNLFFSLARGREALEVLSAARIELRESRAREAVTINEAWLRLHAGEPGAAVDLAKPLLASPIADSRAGAGIVAAMALALSGHSSEALAAADEADAADSPPPYPQVSRHLGFPSIVRAIALLEAGRLEEAAAAGRSGYEAALTMGEPFRRAHWTFLLGRAALARGLVRTAGRHFEEGAALQRQLRQPGLLRWNLGGVALAAAHTGDVEKAEAALEEARAIGPRPERLFESYLDRGQAWTAIARGQRAAGLATLERAANAAIRAGIIVLAAPALHDLARLGLAARVAARLARLAERSDSALLAAFARHAAALAEHDADRLEQCAGEFERLGAILLAAEAAAAAAAQLVADGHRRRAQAQRLRAAALADRCEGARTPMLLSLAGEAPLSAREHEIATLAAQGLTSREIAELLVVSVRTVEKHLEHVFEKLGVGGREELGEALARAGPQAIRLA